MMKRLTPLFRITFLFAILLLNNICNAQLWDNYDGVDDLTYTVEDGSYWIITNGVFEAQTGGVTLPEHSYSSYDMTNKIASWNLSNSNGNEWIGWMDLNRTTVSGWGAGSYSCGFVLAANSSDFNNSSVQGYACGFCNTNDLLVLFKFNDGIQGGTTELPTGASEVVASTYTYSDSDNGVNVYARLESDGKWTIKWKAGAQLSDSDAIVPANYSDGTVTSSNADETYRGTSYKYSGWIYAHNTGGNDKAYFDNYGFGQNGALPVELSNFTAALENENIILRWRTETEVNNYGFDVQRLIDNRNVANGFLYDRDISHMFSSGWETLRFVAGYGNCNSPKDYCFPDENISLTGLYKYRLKQIDFDGTFEYSPEVIIDVTTPGNFVLHNNYPNPFNPSTTISIELPTKSDVKVSVYNILGELIRVVADDYYPAGRHNYIFNATGLPTGLYLYSVEKGKQKHVGKMLYIK